MPRILFISLLIIIGSVILSHLGDPIRITECKIVTNANMAIYLVPGYTGVARLSFEKLIPLLPTNAEIFYVDYKGNYKLSDASTMLARHANGFEGRTDSEFHTLRDASPDPFTYRYGNFESSQDVYRRTASFLSTLATSSYHNILIVTSRHNLRHFRHLLDHLDPRRSLSSDVANATVLVRYLPLN